MRFFLSFFIVFVNVVGIQNLMAQRSEWGVLQKSEGFSLYRNSPLNEKQECYLSLYRNFEYMLEISERVSADIVENILLSAGCYESKGNELILHDAFYGFSQVVVKEAKGWIVKEGYPWMIGKAFIFEDDNTLNKSNHWLNSRKQLETNLKKLYRNSPKVIFSSGIYQNERSVVIRLDKQGSYELKEQSIIISQGNWRREGNKLLLIDDNLHYTWNIFIRKDGLVLPFYGKGVFEKKE